MSNHLPLIQLFHELQVTVFIFDYQGYGKSEGLTCSEEKTRADALGAWYYLTRNRGIPEKKIIVFGRSLGAAIASQLCTEINPMGLILEAPFLSAKAMAKLLYPYFPSSLLLKYDFDNRKALPKLRLPKLILHSRDDQLVPFSHGKLLFDVALPPKQFTSLKGGHGNSFSVSNPTYTAAVSSFLNTLLQTPLKQ